MAREKKSMKKISDAGVIETAVKRNREAHRREIANQLKDKDLYSVNIGKEGLKGKREKLAKDRFKNKNILGQAKSLTEVTLKKKLALKGAPMANSVKKTPEIFDVWGDSDSTKNFDRQNIKIARFKEFSKKTCSKVKPVQ